MSSPSFPKVDVFILLALKSLGNVKLEAFNVLQLIVDEFRSVPSAKSKSIALVFIADVLKSHGTLINLFATVLSLLNAIIFKML